MPAPGLLQFTTPHRMPPNNLLQSSQHRIMPQLVSFTHQPNVSQPSKSVGDNTLQSSNGGVPTQCEPNNGGSKNIEKWFASNYQYWKYAFARKPYGRILEELDRVTSVEEQMAEEASEHGGEAVYDITCDPLA
ncbi:hypothetical protein IFM89_016793 [Coptis chinensis]|uniref:Uncharacterized protein n=1 Tax=Coptis chinensis TaxID=261450 RepID=A0A835J0M1_9MAGN|nr:hypothetical protein IFM89_016793 [Coptis chinensis]